MITFLCWEKVTMIDLQRFVIIHWFFFKEIFPWGKVIHFGTLGPIFWAIGSFSRRYFFGENCPFWHYFGPHLLSHWFFFKKIFPWGKVVHSDTTLGPIFWAIGSFSKRLFLGKKLSIPALLLAQSFEPHWFVKYKNKYVQTFAWSHWNPSNGFILRTMFCHYVWIASYIT